MRHTREEVIRRTIDEYERLDGLVANLSLDEWGRLVPRPVTKDPWTVKDALAHITHWKADILRKARGLPKPTEERGLNETEYNHLVYMRWKDHNPQEVLAWNRQVQRELMEALREAPEGWFSDKERNARWPYDVDGHSAYHRIKEIEKVLKKG